MLAWNYYALMVAAIKGIPPEEAFELLETGEKPIHKKLTLDDVADMVKLKETMTYREIGAIYNMKQFAVYSRIRKYRASAAMSKASPRQLPERRPLT